MFLFEDFLGHVIPRLHDTKLKRQPRRLLTIEQASNKFNLPEEELRMIYFAFFSAMNPTANAEFTAILKKARRRVQRRVYARRSTGSVSVMAAA